MISATNNTHLPITERNRQTDGRTDGRTGGRKDVRTYTKTDTYTNTQPDTQTCQGRLQDFWLGGGIFKHLLGPLWVQRAQWFTRPSLWQPGFNPRAQKHVSLVGGHHTELYTRVRSAGTHSG
ncbi:hypothetical protein DPMN_183810 [Dreissena polymorpha]|uniref:Uncharacterized protein n=1 Tax=Dreissena polymorpha TaxID=45954 RepID=A0A9D4DKK2_DREPO|nr:hypothetical protein DPMN_183810 [Dreissena polymorpha]